MQTGNDCWYLISLCLSFRVQTGFGFFINSTTSVSAAQREHFTSHEWRHQKANRYAPFSQWGPGEENHRNYQPRGVWLKWRVGRLNSAEWNWILFKWWRLKGIDLQWKVQQIFKRAEINWNGRKYPIFCRHNYKHNTFALLLLCIWRVKCDFELR